MHCFKAQILNNKKGIIILQNVNLTNFLKNIYVYLSCFGIYYYEISFRISQLIISLVSAKAAINSELLSHWR